MPTVGSTMSSLPMLLPWPQALPTPLLPLPSWETSSLAVGHTGAAACAPSAHEVPMLPAASAIECRAYGLLLVIF